MSDAPAAPPAPDYAAAAKETASGNMDNLRAQTQANRYDQFTPYGSQTWKQTDANNPDKWASTINLDPRAQEALDTQLGASNQIGALSQEAGNRTALAFDQPFDASSVGDIANQSYANQTSRLDPQWDTASKSLDSRLSNQGIMSGSEADTNARRTFGQQQNDAYTQARQAAISTMPQTYQLATSLRNQPLNEWNAIRTGTQIQNPTFGATPAAGYTPGADMLGAANGQYGGALNAYNGAVGNANSQNSATVGIVGALGTAAAIF